MEKEKEDTEVEDEGLDEDVVEDLHEDAEEEQQAGVESNSSEEDTYHSAPSGEDSA